MRAAVISGPRRLEVREFAPPRPGPGEVLLRVSACGVCGSNLHSWRDPELSVAEEGGPGVGAAGHEVAALAPDGSCVVVEPNRAGSCGLCEPCRSGSAWFCRNRRSLPAWGFAEWMVVAEAGCYPTTAPPSVATLAEPLACAVHALRHAHTRLQGRRVAVLGAGVTGLLTAAAAHHLGAEAVVVSARHGHQARLATAFGASEVALETAGLRGFDIVVEAVGGTAPTFEQALAAARPGGEVIILGLFDQPRALDLRRATWKELRLFFPVTYGRLEGRDDFQLAIDLIEAGEYPFASLVSHRFDLENVQLAFETAADKASGSLRVLVEPAPEPVAA